MKDLTEFTSSELEYLIKINKKQLVDLEGALFDAKIKEHNEKYIRVKVEGCEGCELEYHEWNHVCDHCDGWHFEDKLIYKGE